MKIHTLSLDAETIHKDFPLLARRVNNQRIVYLDNASTTQKPQQVIAAEKHYYETFNANVHRGIYTIAEEATLAYEQAHRTTARFINASFPEIIFTKGCTESINLVASSFLPTLTKGDEIVVSIMEHHSNFVPWQQLARNTGATLKIIDISDDYHLIPELPITHKTKIVALSHMSNVLGTINPVNEIGKVAHEHDALFLVDAAQSAPHLPLDVKKIGADFLTFSSHKMYGPTGLGVLYGKKDILEGMHPFHYGGDMIKEVTIAQSTWNELPWKFEAGTPHIAGAIGFAAALDYLNTIGMEAIQQHEHQLTLAVLHKLQQVKNLTLYGPQDITQGPLFSFNLKGIHSHDVCSIADQFGVALRGGHHCAMPLMKRLGVSSTARASFSFYNTLEDVDKLITALTEATKTFSQ